MRALHPGQLHDLFSAAINAKDREALLALYEPEGMAVDLDGKEYTGAAALRAMFDGLLASMTHITGTTRKVFRVGDLALTSASWQAEVVLPDGSTRQVSGTTAELARRQVDGTWRFVIDDPTFI